MHSGLLAHEQAKHPGLRPSLPVSMFFSLLALSFCAALGRNTQFLLKLWNPALALCSRCARSLGTRHKPGCCVLEASGTGAPGIPQRDTVHGGEGREGAHKKTELNPGRTFEGVVMKTEDLGKENSR